MLTRQHFAGIAAAIAASKIPAADDQFYAGYEAARVESARRLAEYFEADNPRFDRARFLAACEAR